MALSSVELLLASAVVVLLVVVLALGQRLSTLQKRVTRLERAVQPQLPVGGAGLALDLEQQVRELVISGRKIEAIKLVRERTGLGLAEAKGVVDRF